MKQSASIRFPTALMYIGGALTAWGLFAPLAKFPLIGSVSYAQPDFGGGSALAWMVVVLFGLSLGLLHGNGTLRNCGWGLAGAAPGLLAGTLIIRRAWVIDKLQQLADATGQMDGGVEALLSKMETANGAFALGGGVALWLFGLAWRVAVQNH